MQIKLIKCDGKYLIDASVEIFYEGTQTNAIFK